MNQSTALQLLPGGRLTAAHAANVRAQLRARVYRQAELAPEPQAIARRNGIGYREVLELVMEESGLRARRAHQDGFLQGQRSVWRPQPPTERRAA